MLEIRIKHKYYKKLETLTLGKLEHIRQLAQIEVDNYKPFVLTAPSRRKLIVEGTMRRLKAQVKILDDLIEKKKQLQKDQLADSYKYVRGKMHGL